MKGVSMYAASFIFERRVFSTISLFISIFVELATQAKQKHFSAEANTPKNFTTVLLSRLQAIGVDPSGTEGTCLPNNLVGWDAYAVSPQ
jgi:hypothetical protein